ncbi:hypothetical protein CLV63_116179 [Murinocardiopsis flavida]|uniref:TROVE domain-containing protein n=1 Tax=Murinocardiopsis flavida TaxID=645275 RepID=A0A2P8D992_9ACTN|nr:hypothetical protein [Murinocardiopsis flavida]PSK93772.1 hypothetical protein CLV63_116179 [Murinocardiopsis flavida]
MTDTFADLLACEDIVMFANAAIAGTGQREFRSTAAAQRFGLRFLHDYVCGNYRDVYTAMLAIDINDHNAATIIHTLLATSAQATPQQRRAERPLIDRRLRGLPPQRAYKLFHALQRDRVNNRRTRAIIRDYRAARPDPALDAVKYRAALKAATRHAHLRLPGEYGTFLYDPLRPARYDTPLLETWRRAHYSASALYDLPLTVAEGFAAKHGIARTDFLRAIAPAATRGEALRLQSAAARADAPALRVDLHRVPLTRLAGYVLSLDLDERARRRGELTGALAAAARTAAGRRAGTWGRTAAVLDDSYSSFGSPAKRRRPLAVALACHYLLDALAERHTSHWVSGRTDPLMAYPRGSSPLAERVLDALETAPPRLIVVSDGHDDTPDVCASVLSAWRHRVDPGRATSVTHLNPVFDAEEFTPVRLSPAIPTVGIRAAENLPALVGLARFAEGTSGLHDLRSHLADQVERYLADSGDPR